MSKLEEIKNLLTKIHEMKSNIVDVITKDETLDGLLSILKSELSQLELGMALKELHSSIDKLVKV